MEHTRTTPQQSVILKKIGYDVPDTCFWLDHLTQGWLEETGYAGEQSDHNNNYSWTYTRPKLTDVATWLRTVKEWYVSPQPNFDGIASQWVYEVFVFIGGDWKKVKGVGGFDTHDLALSAGIDFILTKLNEDI
jgi:hypothetical protein